MNRVDGICLNNTKYFYTDSFLIFISFFVFILSLTMYLYKLSIYLSSFFLSPLSPPFFPFCFFQYKYLIIYHSFFSFSHFLVLFFIFYFFFNSQIHSLKYVSRHTHFHFHILCFFWRWRGGGIIKLATHHFNVCI